MLNRINNYVMLGVAGVLVAIIASYTLAGSFAPLFNQLTGNSGDNPQEEEQRESQEQDKQAAANIATVKNIEGQRIKSISTDKIELENGAIINLDPNQNSLNDCQIGDVIYGYDEERESFICQDTTGSRSGNRYIYVRRPLDTGDVLFGFWLNDYFKSRSYLKNNGFTDSGNSFTHSSGRSYNYSRSNTGAVSVAPSTSNSTTNGKSSGKSTSGGNSGGSTGGTTGTGTSGGHGGGAGSTGGGSGSS
jgi:hypothetical protein